VTVDGARFEHLPIDRVIVPERRHRPIGPDEDVSWLRESIAEVGLLTPISVTREMILIFGARRRKACAELGWTRIPALVMPYGAVEAELAEIAENLHRDDLSVLAQGEHLLRWNELLCELGHRAQPGDNQHTTGPDTVTGPVTTADLAARAGLEARTARRRMEIARSLSAEVRDVVRSTPIADCQKDLMTLARLDPDELDGVLAAVVAGAPTLAAARRRARGLPQAEADDEDGEDDPLGPDVADHLRVVETVVTFRYRVPEATVRTRYIAGEERNYPRESHAQPPVEPSFLIRVPATREGVQQWWRDLAAKAKPHLARAVRAAESLAEHARA
jgi:ParB family transcriptional regulator, chromosome partitioning protein